MTEMYKIDENVKIAEIAHRDQCSTLYQPQIARVLMMEQAFGY